MVEKEQRIVLPPTLAEPESEASASPFFFLPGNNGIDMKMDNPKFSFKYEEVCFTELMAQNPELFGIGPHLIDYAFGGSTFLWEIRPDAMLFKADQDGLALVGLSEFKSNKTNGLHRKVLGFSRLLKRLRENPAFLPLLLNDVGEGEFNFPDIKIPHNSEVDVSFISPFPKQEVKDGKFPFRVSFMVVQAPGLTS